MREILESLDHEDWFNLFSLQKMGVSLTLRRPATADLFGLGQVLLELLVRFDITDYLFCVKLSTVSMGCVANIAKRSVLLCGKSIPWIGRLSWHMVQSDPSPYSLLRFDGVFDHLS